MKSKTPSQVPKTPHENGRSVSEKKNPLFRAAKHILLLLQNRVIASLMMFGQGILFIIIQLRQQSHSVPNTYRSSRSKAS